MERTCVQLEDLPDEILLIIFQNLHNYDVLYSFMNLNKRFDTILNDRIFTRNLTLRNSVHGSSCQVTDIILDRFCLEILPKINNKIERLNIESLFMERILLATNYPNLHALSLYNFVPETAREFFCDKSYLIHQFENQISSFFIKLKPRKQLIDELGRTTQNRNIFIFIKICIHFKNLRYLNFSSSSTCEQLTFSNVTSNKFSSNLLELHVVVKNIFDCLCLLDGQFNQLHTFYVTVRPRGIYEAEIVGNHEKLPNLKCFSLIHEDQINIYECILIPLIQRMTNLEELSLYFVKRHGSIIDGDNLEKNIINHMTRLNKFTFNICSVIYVDQSINLPSNEDIENTFRNFQNNTIISNFDYFSRRNLFYYHVYSYPYIWTSYRNITNNFSGGLFKYVREISLYDERAFEHDFFLRIAQSFPHIKKLILHNDEPQQNNHLQSLVITYPHLIEIDLVKVHEDYLEQFLNNTKICLLDNVHLRVCYGSLKKVTNDFTSDATRINCSKVTCLIICDYTLELSKLKDYFPHAIIY